MHVGSFCHSRLLTVLVAAFFSFSFFTGSGRALGLEKLGDPPPVL